MGDLVNVPIEFLDEVSVEVERDFSVDIFLEDEY